MEVLRARFDRFTRNLIVLHGGMAARELHAAQAGLQPGGSGEPLVLATGRYLGEGFDDSRLDTLFLVMPISWTGTLAGVVHRRRNRHRDRLWRCRPGRVDFDGSVRAPVSAVSSPLSCPPCPHGIITAITALSRFCPRSRPKTARADAPRVGKRSSGKGVFRA
jgi:hypothetical protein